MAPTRSLAKLTWLFSHWRSLVLSLFLLVGAKLVLVELEKVYPVQDWLVWPLASVWGYTLLLNLAFCSVGQLLLTRVLRVTELPALERLLYGTALGVVAYTLAMYAAGALDWFSPTMAVGLAVVFAASGIRELLPVVGTLRRSAPTDHSLLHVGALCFGVLCLGLMYLQLMTPDALNYDATWCHITIAQDYAREGGIVPFPADYSKNVPHLASIVHTWGFLVPGLAPALRWMMVLHVEFSLFLWTLVGIAAGTRWAVGSRVPHVWAVMFLFPILFVYDNNLGGAADHVLAFFSVPAVLACARVLTTRSRAMAFLVGICLGGAALTKYQAIYLGLPIAVALLIQGLFGAAKLVRDPARRKNVAFWFALIQPSLVVGTVAAFIAAPHFIKNWVFYGNPMYPFMQRVFTHSHPTVQDGWYLFEYIFKDYVHRPKGPILERLANAAEIFVTFSLRPHYSFTKNFPAFGFLFTLLLPTVVLIRHKKRALYLLAMGSCMVFLWAVTFPVDRNLQTVLPVLVCGTAVLLVQLWRLGALARVAVGSAVALQLIWNGDAYFYSGHSRMQSAVDLIRSGYEGRAATRFDGYFAHRRALGEALPPDARLLLHKSHQHLGIDRQVLLDWMGFQGLFDYRALQTPRALYDSFAKQGITHIAYIPRSAAPMSLQEEILFSALAKDLQPGKRVGGYHLLEMKSELRPPAEQPYRALVLGVAGYGDGIYDIERLGTLEYLPAPFRAYQPPTQPWTEQLRDRDAALEDVDAVLVGPLPLVVGTPARLTKNFQSVGTTQTKIRVYLAKKAPPPPATKKPPPAKKPPAVDRTPAKNQPPAVDETPAKNQPPAVDETPAKNQPPAVNQAPPTKKPAGSSSPTSDEKPH